LLSTRYFTPPAYQHRRRKLASKYAGPYEVVKVVTPVAVKLRLPQGTKAHPVFHTSMLKPYVVDPRGRSCNRCQNLSLAKDLRSTSLRRCWLNASTATSYSILSSGNIIRCLTASWEPLHNVADNDALLEFQKSRQEPSASKRGVV
jgi:hypothetical protein